MNVTPKIRQSIRRACGIKFTGVAVNIIPDSVQEPVLSGDRGGYFTKTGIPIRYPSAYSKKGWSTMTYHCSTRSISVGEEYIKETFGELT
jgi:hypothetical protein